MAELERIQETRARVCSSNSPNRLSVGNLEETLPRAVNKRRQEWLTEVNIDPRFFGSTFDTFDRKAQPAAYDKSAGFVGKVFSRANDILALVLSSTDYGIGKTHLLTAIAWKLLDKSVPAYIGNYTDGEITYNLPTIKYNPCPAFYINETELLTLIKSTYDKDSQDNELKVFARLNKYPLLLIDDVGKVRARDISYTQQIFYRLVEYRWANYKHLALASNLVGKALSDYLGGAVESRLFDMCGWSEYFLTLTGRDWRLNK